MIRFSNFEGQWESKKLGEIAKFSKGKGISKSDIDIDGIIECIRYGELYTHYGEVINEIKSRTNLNTSVLVLSESNDVIIPSSGESTIDIATASCVLKSGIALGGDLNIIKTDNNGVFLSYYLNSRKKIEIANLAQGVSVVHLYSGQLASLILNLPAHEEQNRIAAFLTKLDERISTQSKIIEELQLLKKTTSKSIFKRTLRFQSSHENIFQEWHKKFLGEIATIATGNSNRVDSVLDGKYIFFDRSQDIRTSHRYLYDKESIIVPGEGQEFTPRYFKGKFDLHQRTYAIFDFKNSNGKYIFYYISQNDKHLQSQAVGSTVKSLRLPMFETMPIFLPSLEEQNKISILLSTLDDKIELEKRLLLKYENQKKYFLQNLFI